MANEYAPSTPTPESGIFTAREGVPNEQSITFDFNNGHYTVSPGGVCNDLRSQMPGDPGQVAAKLAECKQIMESTNPAQPGGMARDNGRIVVYKGKDADQVYLGSGFSVPVDDFVRALAKNTHERVGYVPSATPMTPTLTPTLKPEDDWQYNLAHGPLLSNCPGSEALITLVLLASLWARRRK